MNPKLLMMLIFLVSINMSLLAQKIVFSDDYNKKNAGYDRFRNASIAEDSTTKERVFIYLGRRELLFYQIDAKWNVIKKINVSTPKGSAFNDNSFTILKSLHNKDKWSFALESNSGVTKETIDFGSGTLVVDLKFMEDRNPKIDSKLFEFGSQLNIIYFDNTKQINVLEFNADLVATSTKLDISSNLPTNKNTKYKAEDLFNQITLIDNLRALSSYFTRNKIQFYSTPENYSILVTGEEPLAELTQFDKKTGKKLMSNIYSLATALNDKGNLTKYSTAALLFGNKLHLLAASPSGGMYAVIDPDTKAVLFQKAYNEEDKNTIFNYGPVKYETIPTTAYLSVKEKVEDITMNKFATELYKYSTAITAKRLKDGQLLITIGNWDMKQLLAPTSAFRTGVNTITSHLWYVASSAGLIFEPASWKVSSTKTTWNEANNSTARDKYSKVDFGKMDSDSPEHLDKKTTILNTQYIGNRYYVIYLKGFKEIKIFEKTGQMTLENVNISNQ